MLGKNYIIVSIASVTVLYLLTVQAARLVEGQSERPSPAPTDSVAQAEWTKAPANEEEVLVQLDSLMQAIRGDFLPGSSALQQSMEPQLVRLVALMNKPWEDTFTVELYEADRELARERAENLRNRLQLYGLPVTRLRILAEEGPSGLRIQRTPNA